MPGEVHSMSNCYLEHVHNRTCNSMLTSIRRPLNSRRVLYRTFYDLQLMEAAKKREWKAKILASSTPFFRVLYSIRFCVYKSISNAQIYPTNRISGLHRINFVTPTRNSISFQNRIGRFWILCASHRSENDL